MQATMYGYSRNLLQIRPSRLQTSGMGMHGTHEELAQDASLTLERDSLAAGERVRAQLELPKTPEAAEVVLLLTQRERSRCHGLETVLEQVVQTLHMRAHGGDWLELELPAGLPATIVGRQLEVSYVLSVTIDAQEDLLQGSTGIEVLGTEMAPAVRSQGPADVLAAGGGSVPPSSVGPPPPDASRVS
jgi:hypothetical protein